MCEKRIEATNIGESHAKPGDIIKITNKNDQFYGYCFPVVEPPNYTYQTEKCVCILWADEYWKYEHNEYLVICDNQIVKNTKNVDQFLKDQTNSNLDSIFG